MSRTTILTDVREGLRIRTINRHDSRNALRRTVRFQMLADGHVVQDHGVSHGMTNTGK